MQQTHCLWQPQLTSSAHRLFLETQELALLQLTAKEAMFCGSSALQSSGNRNFLREFSYPEPCSSFWITTHSFGSQFLSPHIWQVKAWNRHSALQMKQFQEQHLLLELFIFEGWYLQEENVVDKHNFKKKSIYGLVGFSQRTPFGLGHKPDNSERISHSAFWMSPSFSTSCEGLLHPSAPDVWDESCIKRVAKSTKLKQQSEV